LKLLDKKRRSQCKVEDKVKEEGEDVAVKGVAELAQEEHAFAHPAVSEFPTNWEHPATQYHAHPAAKK
jgi:hypothetical protein